MVIAGNMVEFVVRNTGPVVSQMDLGSSPGSTGFKLWDFEHLNLDALLCKTS